MHNDMFLDYTLMYFLFQSLNVCSLVEMLMKDKTFHQYWHLKSNRHVINQRHLVSKLNIMQYNLVLRAYTAVQMYMAADFRKAWIELLI